MKAVSATSPASPNSLATAPMRRMFSSRSWAEKPRPNRLANSSPCRSLSMPGPAFRPWRMLSPSRTKLCKPQRVQLVIDQVRDGALAAGAQAGEPDHAAGMAVAFFPFRPADAVFVPMDLDLMLLGHSRKTPSCWANGTVHFCGLQQKSAKSPVMGLERPRRRGRRNRAARRRR